MADLGAAGLTFPGISGTPTILGGADLTGAHLGGVNLPRAYLSTANFTGADLRTANLTGADLRDADLTGADLSNETRSVLPGTADVGMRDANLTGANLTGALMQPGAVIPVGWQRDTHSGRLKRADTSPGGTTAS